MEESESICLYLDSLSTALLRLFMSLRDLREMRLEDAAVTAQQVPAVNHHSIAQKV